ncbi:MAG: hypothetical protein GY772_05010 [bacterium]|nr:hypothetical protein [bacterium]
MLESASRCCFWPCSASHDCHRWLVGTGGRVVLDRFTGALLRHRRRLRDEGGNRRALGVFTRLLHIRKDVQAIYRQWCLNGGDQRFPSGLGT